MMPATESQNGTPHLSKTRVVDTPADTLWVPTPEELLAGKVVTRVNR